MEDETDLLLFPPLRANWSQRGQPARVLISGRNARCVVFGAMNLRTGKRLFLARQHQRQHGELRIELLWLPKRAPELNPMDELWGQGKDIVSANLQYPTIDNHLHAFIEYLECLTNWEARYTAGILSEGFWLKSVL